MRYLTRKARAAISKIFHKVRTGSQGGDTLWRNTFSTWETGQYCYNAARINPHPWRKKVSDKANIDEREADGVADAMAVTGIIAVIVLTMYIWLSGMPS